jgi:hypothetical protein
MRKYVLFTEKLFVFEYCLYLFRFSVISLISGLRPSMTDDWENVCCFKKASLITYSPFSKLFNISFFHPNMKTKFSSQILSRLTFSDSVQSHNWNKTPYNISDILFSSVVVEIWWENMCYLLRNCLCLNIVYIYCYRAEHLYTCQQRVERQMWQMFYWRQVPHCLL